jgi:hypothetical protein
VVSVSLRSWYLAFTDFNDSARQRTAALDYTAAAIISATSTGQQQVQR